MMAVKSNLAFKYDDYLRSDKTTLEQVYKRPSYYKYMALEYIEEHLMPKYNGKDLRIISHNTNIFTVGFIGTIKGRKAFFYITPKYNRYMYVI